MKQFPPSVIYVGLQKTGSTFLRHYFYSHPDIHCSRHGLFFQTDAAAGAAEAVRARYAALFVDDPGAPCRVDMYESLAMGYLLRGLDAWDARAQLTPGQRLGSGPTVLDPRALAERIRAAVPDARIILTVRNQVDWLDSNYRHFLPLLPEGRASFADFLTTVEGKILLDAGHYDRIVALYREVFGADRLHVLPLEQLDREEEPVLRALCNFLGVGFVPYAAESRNYNRGRSISRKQLPGASPGQPQSGEVSLFRRVFSRSRSGLSNDAAADDVGVLSAEEAGMLRCIYATSNLRFAAQLSLDLAPLGYLA